MEELQLPMDQALQTLDADALMRFQRLQTAAVSAVTERFYAVHSAAYERFGETGRDACRSDLAFHLEFLRPVLQFGMLKPMVDYLRWLNQVLAARGIPTQHLPQSLDWLAGFFAEHLPPNEGSVVAAALQAARRELLATDKTPVVLAAPAPWPEMPELEAALLAGDQRAALAIMNRCMQAGRSLVDVEMHLIQPALYTIGEKWQANQVSEPVSVRLWRFGLGVTAHTGHGAMMAPVVVT